MPQMMPESTHSVDQATGGPSTPDAAAIEINRPRSGRFHRAWDHALMTDTPAHTDGLADSYERTRPRYPVELFAHAVSLLPARARPVVLDAGAGTGIALEALLPLLPAG